MQYRRLPNSDLTISRIGLGCAAMGRDPSAWGPVDDNESIAAIHAALDVGVNWLVTSPAYGAGHSEDIVGRAIQGLRERVVLATQCIPPSAGDQTPRDANDGIIRQCDASLRRLHTDHIDLYLCHRPEDERGMQSALTQLSTLLSQGKVQAVGAIGLGCEQLLAWRAAGPLHLITAPANVLEQDALGDLLPAAVRQEVGFAACSPLCRGLLTGKYSAITRFRDLRARDRQFNPPRYSANLAVVDALRGIAARRGRSLVQLAVGWVLARAEITAAVAGAKRASQVREWSGAGELTLRPEELSEIEALVAARDERVAQARGEV